MLSPSFIRRVVNFVDREKPTLQRHPANHENLSVTLEHRLMIGAVKKHCRIKGEGLGCRVVHLGFAVRAGARKSPCDEHFPRGHESRGMVGSRDDHQVRRRREGFRGWIVDLSRGGRDGTDVAAGDKDCAVRQPGRHVPLTTLHRSSSRLGETVPRRIKYICALASYHQDRPVAQERGGVLSARSAHPLRRQRKGAGHRVVNLSRLQKHQRSSALVATGDKDAPIGQQSGGLILPRGRHRPGRGKNTRCRIVEESRGEHIALIHPARDEDLARLKQGGRVTRPLRIERNQLRQRSGCCEKSEDEER